MAIDDPGGPVHPAIARQTCAGPPKPPVVGGNVMMHDFASGRPYIIFDGNFTAR